MYTTLCSVLPKQVQQGPTTSIVDLYWQSSVADTPQAQGSNVPIFGEDYAKMPLT